MKDFLNQETPHKKSACFYIKVDPSKVHMVRYLLEARDNLGIMSVVDRWGGALKIRYSPDQKEEITKALFEIQQAVEIAYLLP